jgi:hypothetical protein
MSGLLSSFLSYEASCKLSFDDRCRFYFLLSFPMKQAASCKLSFDDRYAAAAAVSPASKQARWDHKPVNFFALSFTTKVKLGWENSICVVFFFPPSPSLLPPALENAHAPSFLLLLLDSCGKTAKPGIKIHTKNTQPKESHKVKAAAEAAAGRTAATTNNNNNNVVLLKS